MSNKYINKINNEILSKIDYEKLGESYQTDMVYAKKVYQSLRDAFETVYGHNDIDVLSEKMDTILLPGIVESKKSKEVCIGIFELDLTSSGEHYGTFFLSKFGVVPQFGNKQQDIKEYVKSFIPYNYYYDAIYEGDIHTANDIPQHIKEKFYESPTFDIKMS